MKTKISEQIIDNYIISSQDEGVTEYKITLKLIENDEIKMEDYRGQDLVFTEPYDKMTLDRWEAVCKLILKAIKLARKNLV